MGTQQILLIVLSVIIVGAAIAVGITMFNNQSYNSNKTALAAEAQNYASQVVQYYKTPLSQGGAGGTIAEADTTKIGQFIGWGAGFTNTETGVFKIKTVTPTSVMIEGYGKEAKGTSAKYPKLQTTITFPKGTIATTLTDEARPAGY